MVGGSEALLAPNFKLEYCFSAEITKYCTRIVVKFLKATKTHDELFNPRQRVRYDFDGSWMWYVCFLQVRFCFSAFKAKGL